MISEPHVTVTDDPVLTPAGAIKVGDIVDLAGDRYADPLGDNVALDCEYAVVCEVTRETPACVAIGFEGFDTVGFPPDHMLAVHGHDAGYDEDPEAEHPDELAPQWRGVRVVTGLWSSRGRTASVI